MDYNYGTAMNKLIVNYSEMLELIIHARLASDRIDEWKETLKLVTNPDQTHSCWLDDNSNKSPHQFYRDYL